MGFSKARVIEQTLISYGFALDYQFGPRPRRTKIKLGVLAAHFGPQTETFATLPLYRHIDRSRFEVVLISLESTGHPLEQLCRGAADQFLVLTQQLAEQVQTIRQADRATSCSWRRM